MLRSPRLIQARPSSTAFIAADDGSVWGQLGEHPLGGADGFLTSAQPPCCHGERVEVVGVQRHCFRGADERLVGREPILADVCRAGRQQKFGVGFQARDHLDRFNGISPQTSSMDRFARPIQ